MADKHSPDMLLDRVSKVTCHKCDADVDVRDAQPFEKVTCPECGASLPVPATLGQFVLFREMGKGAMGAVYQGFDRNLKRHVGIKVMLKSLGDDPTFVENFQGEAQSLAALNHPNVVQVYSFGKEYGQPYIVMELVNGEKLDDLMNRGEPISEERILEIGIDVAKGLKAANEVGITHGDIKPQNILMDRKGTAKVVDFGLAQGAKNQHSLDGVWGTPYYIAPEKARKQKSDHKADIYSLGATLFYALAGEPPFDGKTAKDVIIARFKQEAPNLAEIRPDIHPATARLIARMLEADPIKRYPTYDSLLPDMEKALSDVRKGPAQPEAPKKSKGKRVALISGLVLLLAAIGGGWWWMQSQAESGEKEAAPQGRKVMKLVNGRLVAVTVYDEPSAEAGSEGVPPGLREVALNTADGKGGDAFIRGGEDAETNFGGKPVLEVSAEPDHPAKAYVRFDMRALNVFNIREARLELQVAPNTPTNTGPARVVLYGLQEGRGAPLWKETPESENGSDMLLISWDNAPANVPDSPTELKGEAVELARTSLPTNGPAGTTIRIANDDSVDEDGFVSFLQDDRDEIVTLVLTIEPENEGSEPVPTAFFVSREGSGDPPTLRLFTK